MAFAWEYPLRQEVRRGYAANVLTWWARTPGAGPVTLAAAPTYVVYSPSGAVLASGTASKTDVASVGSYATVTIDASDTTTYQLEESYRVEFTFTSTIVYVDSLYFDCVRQPFVSPVHLSDLVAELADAERRLTRQAETMATGRTSAQQAWMHSSLAWGDTMALIRSAGTGALPRLIVDREAIRRVVTAYAVSRMLRADDDTQRADEWEQRAQARFRALGPLRYDTAEDGSASGTVSGWGSVRTRRAW